MFSTIITAAAHISFSVLLMNVLHKYSGFLEEEKQCKNMFFVCIIKTKGLGPISVSDVIS